jgi:hypothetical protein
MTGTPHAMRRENRPTPISPHLTPEMPMSSPEELRAATAAAAAASLTLVGAVHTAHRSSTEAGGPMELLLREAIEAAVALNARLATIARFADDAASATSAAGNG